MTKSWRIKLAWRNDGNAENNQHKRGVSEKRQQHGEHGVA